MNRSFNFRNIAVAAILSLAGVIGLSAFTQPENLKTVKEKRAKQWFVYTGSDIAGESNQLNYTEYTAGGEPEDCGGGEMRCAIYAEPVTVSGTVRPDLSQIDASQTKHQLQP